MQNIVVKDGNTSTYDIIARAPKNQHTYYLKTDKKQDSENDF